MGCCLGKHKNETETAPSQPLLPNEHKTEEQGVRLFSLVDVDHSGGITLGELQRALEKVSIQRELGWPSTRYQELFDLLDPSNTGNVTRKSLVHYMKVKALFDTIDVSRNGIISSWELEGALRDNDAVRHALGVPEHIAISLFKQMDTDNSGSISLVEFYRYYTQAALQEPYSSPHGWQQMARRLQDRIDKDHDGEISLVELASALRCDRTVQLELGWAPHKAAELYSFLSREHSGGITPKSLENFCRIRWLFYRIDKNRSDFIDGFEFGAALSTPSMQRELDVPLSQAQRIFKEMDVDRRNHVSFETFFRYFKQRPSSPVADHGPISVEVKPAVRPADKYTKVRKLGQGGFGEVFLITRNTDGLELVMKRPILSSGVKMEEVQQEAAMMARLKHPHIVRLIETYEEQTPQGVALIIITEYADGGDLRQKLKREPNGMDPAEVKRLFTQVLDALKYTHSRRVLHRDLKPDNILLTGGGTAKLADLGLATQIKGNNDLLTVCGTPVYMAPEVLDERGYDFKADMFSMGCILYEMCRSTLCFKSIAAVVKGDLPTDIPHWCRTLVVDLLQREASLRPDAERAMVVMAQLSPMGGTLPQPVSQSPRPHYHGGGQHAGHHGGQHAGGAGGGRYAQAAAPPLGYQPNFRPGGAYPVHQPLRPYPTRM